MLEQGATLMDPKYESPEGFDADWYAKAAARDPQWAARLQAARGPDRDARAEEYRGQLAGLLARLRGQPLMPPAVQQGSLAEILNAARVPSSSPLMPIHPILGVRG